MNSSNLVERAISIVKDTFTYLLDVDEGQLPSVDRGHAKAIQEIRDRLGSIAAEKYNLDKERREAIKVIADLSEKAEFAVEIGRDDLAKAALSLKAKLNQNNDALARRLDLLDREVKDLRALIDLMDNAQEIDAKAVERLEELDKLIAAHRK